jgi:arylsulfatase A-like enzyme
LWALAIVVLAIKVAKVGYKFVDFYGLRPAADSWLLRALLIALACFAVSRLKVLAREPLRRFRPLLIALPALITFAGKLALGLLTRDADHAFGWLVHIGRDGAVVGRVLYNALRPDVLFLSSFALIAHGLTRLTPERHRPRLHKVIGAVIALCIVFSGLELAQYTKTGLPATGQLLGFFVTNVRGISAMVLSQLDAVTIAALLAPIALGFAISRLELDAPLLPSLPAAWPHAALAALVLLSGFVRPARIDHLFDQTCDDTFLALRDLAPWRSNGQIQAMRRASRMPLIFDTRKATLRPRGARPTKNVIIVMLESTRAASTSLYNPKLDTTPFMVELAKRGATVSTMYAGAPRTNAAWVLAVDGVYCSSDDEMEALAKTHPRTLTSLPALLEPLGYSSAFFTSAFLNFMYDTELVRSMRFGTVQDGNSLPHEGFEQVSYTGYEDRQVVQPMLSWVRQQADAHKPFFLMWMTNVGHFPFTPPTSWPHRSFDAKDEVDDRYLNSLAYVDTIVRELVGGLDALGVMQNSILLVLGDHGESMGEHGPRVHTLCIYDETLRIPAILAAPGQIQPGSAIGGVRQEIDILPTFADLLGLDVEHATLPGIPLTGPAPADRTLYFGGEEGAQFLAMRKGDLKFIYSYERSPTEVYSLAADPGERRDLAPALDPKVVEQAETEMLVWHERVSLATNARP